MREYVSPPARDPTVSYGNLSKVASTKIQNCYEIKRSPKAPIKLSHLLSEMNPGVSMARGTYLKEPLFLAKMCEKNLVKLKNFVPQEGAIPISNA